MGKFYDASSEQEETKPLGRFGSASLEAKAQTPAPLNVATEDTDVTLYDDDLINDVNFQKASEVIYNMNNSVDAERLESPEEYAQYGIETMGWFNWNIPRMSFDAARISGATDEQKQSFLYMMESYDELGMSWNGTKRFIKGAVTDPTNLIGLGTFGIGLAGKEGVKQASKQGIKELLKQSTRGGVILGTEAAFYSGVDDVARQVVETSVSGEDIDLGRTAQSMGIGFGFGFGLGTGAEAVVKKFKGKASKEVEEAIDEEKMIDELPELEDAPVEEIIKAKPIDTRGQGQQYHGTSTELGEFGEGHDYYSSMNIYGQGFYTTDALDVAGGYSKKGKGGNPTKYKVIKTNEANLYDLDKPLDNEALELLSESTEFGADWLEDMAPNPTVRDAFDELRDWSAGEGIPADEVQEMFDSFRYLLEQKGFQGYTHRGGGFTNTNSHRVEIFWNPKDHVRLEKIEDAPVVPKETATPPAQKIRKDLDAVIKAIKRTVPRGKAAAIRPDGTQSTKELLKAVEPFKAMIREASRNNPAGESPQEFADYLMSQRLTDGEGEFLEVAVSQTVGVLKTKVSNLRLKQKQLDGEEAKAISDQIDELEDVIAPLDTLDTAMSTVVAQRQRMRQEGINTGELRGTTIKSLMERSGLSRSEAEKEFDSIFNATIKKKNNTKEMRALNIAIEKANKDGNVAEFIKLKKQKEVKEAEALSDALKKEGNPLYNALNKILKPVNEVMIGFVFSPATLIVNTVPSLAKTIYKPLLNNVMTDGLSATARRKIVAEYSSMWAMKGAALKMAKAAWRYEKSILTGDSARFLENYNTIPKKYGVNVTGKDGTVRTFDAAGSFVRFFPRALLAQDALFEALHYRGYTVGNATGKAMEDGLARGLKGDELDTFVKAETQKALDKAYAPEENAIDILMQDGISRGLKGKKLENFIHKELETNPEVFTKATDQNGRDYVQDILFKRDFSGQSTVSTLAKGYERVVNNNPILRTMGQLFFRTPVRVFEEGLRLTPGVNLISPGFYRDLTGERGAMRQARAQGEALMSYAIGASVMSLYATGNLTGAMGQNYKQTRQGENAGLEPYTIKFSDGSTFNYRNFDPFSTPIKIIVNALEKAETLAYRAEQGESIDKAEFEKARGYVAVGLGSIFQSIRDANLASGVDSAIDFIEDVTDPEGSDQLIKFFGRKAQTFLPNTYYKAQMMDNPVLGDPVTIEQFWKQRINPTDPLVPKQYTAFGRPRTDSNAAAKMYYFSTASEEDRQRGKSNKEFEAEQFLYEMAQVGDTHFTAPYKMPKYMGDIDLRKQLTKDGVESYYDRWMRYTLEQEIGGQTIVDVVHRLRDLPMGTASTPGVAETQTKKYLNKWREAAFVTLLQEEGNLIPQRRSVLEREAKAKSGQRSSDNIMFNIGN